MNTNWVIIDGIVERGHQVASGKAEDNPYPSGTIKMQKPFFKERGLDLEFNSKGIRLYEGTLNVSINPYVFSMKHTEFTFPHVEWTTLHPPEDFSFSCCKVIFDDIEYEGWIYYPNPKTKKTHFQNPSILEIISPLIPNINYGIKVKIAINENEVLLYKNAGHRLPSPSRQEEKRY
jgi:hypothetical protein